MPALDLFEDAATQDELSSGHSRDRDEFQVKIDKDVEALLGRWKQAGKPKPNANGKYNGPTQRYVVKPDDLSTMKGIVRRACTLHKVDPVWFKNAKTEQGRISIKFTLATKPAKN